MSTLKNTQINEDQIIEDLGYLSSLLICLASNHGLNTLSDEKVTGMLTVCLSAAKQAQATLHNLHATSLMGLDSEIGLLDGIYFTLEELKNLNLVKKYTTHCLFGLFNTVEKLAETLSAKVA